MRATGLAAILRGTGRILLRLPRGLALILALAWLALIWFLSEQKVELGPRSLLWAFLSNGAHIPLFGLLALILCLTLKRGAGGWPRLPGKHVLGIVVCVACAGILDEWHQSWTGRHASIMDVLTDTSAAAWVASVAAASSPLFMLDRAKLQRRFWGGLVCCLAAAFLASITAF